jgi:multidrug transporter EmrE-like cation transporter
MTRSILLLLLMVLCGTGGELAITYGMKTVGEPEALRPRALLAFFGRALRSQWFWTGLPLVALSFYLLLVLLSWEPVSFVIPMSALGYVVGAFGGKYILGEEVGPARWVGVALVCTGVVLVATA